jgi:hypothetical protein
VGVVASLAGVTVGALVEPWKLGLQNVPGIRRDRADRCAGLIEAATTARQHLVDLNVLYRRLALAPDTPEADPKRAVQYEDAYYVVRTSLRRFLGLLVMSGPDELVDLARKVRDADRTLHDRRFDLDEDGVFNWLALPPTVSDATKELDESIEQFAQAARHHKTGAHSPHHCPFAGIVITFPRAQQPKNFRQHLPRLATPATSSGRGPRCRPPDRRRRRPRRS